MNVGDYVRIDGYISKIGHIKTSSSGKTYVQWKQPNGLLASANIKLIEKSSPQIIDLIEKNDILVDYNNNLYKVEKVYLDYVFTDKKNEYGQTITLVDYQIKYIMTHEQFESGAYRVEE